MKKIILSLIITGVAGLLVSASAQPAPGDDNTNTPPATDQPGPPPDNGQAPVVAPGDQTPPPDNAVPEPNPSTPSVPITPSRSLTAQPTVYQSSFMPPSQPGTNAADLNLNFVGARLQEVLNYLSDSAGFIVVQETPINNNVRVTMSGKHMTRTEAVNLLNSVLNSNGYAAIRDDRTLTIVDKNDAKTQGIPVKSGNNPDDIPKTAEIVTQIIPIRFVEAQQLVSDLSSFVSPQATVVANQAGNSIVITDTQANIHHLAEIIKAVDDSAEAETEIRVFPLHYASPVDVAAELGNIFPSSTSGNGSQSPIRFGGGPGGGGGGGFFARMMANAGAAGGAGGSNDRIRKATQVNAVADSRIQAVIVTAPKDLMEEIANMMAQLDVASDRDQGVYVFKMNNGDPQQAVQVLQSMFQGNNSRTTQSGQNQNSALQQRQQTSTQQMSSQSSSSGFGGGGGGVGGGGGRGGAIP
jgi:type II secretory pathway component GspD/PulD (secretin)